MRASLSNTSLICSLVTTPVVISGMQDSQVFGLSALYAPMALMNQVTGSLRFLSMRQLKMSLRSVSYSSHAPWYGMTVVP